MGGQDVLAVRTGENCWWGRPVGPNVAEAVVLGYPNLGIPSLWDQVGGTVEGFAEFLRQHPGWLQHVDRVVLSDGPVPPEEEAWLSREPGDTRLVCSCHSDALTDEELAKYDTPEKLLAYAGPPCDWYVTSDMFECEEMALETAYVVSEQGLEVWWINPQEWPNPRYQQIGIARWHVPFDTSEFWYEMRDARIYLEELNHLGDEELLKIQHQLFPDMEVRFVIPGEPRKRIAELVRGRDLAEDYCLRASQLAANADWNEETAESFVGTLDRLLAPPQG